MKGFFKKNLILLCFLCGFLSYNRLAVAEEEEDQAKIIRDYYASKFNEQLRTFDNLSNFIFNDAIDRIFVSNRQSGLLTRLNNNWIRDSDSNYKAYNINLNLGYSFIISNFLIMPIFEVGFTSSRINDEIKADLNNWSFTIPGLYAFYGFENGLFGDLFFSYRLDNGSNRTKGFKEYNKSKNERSFNVRTSLGWNFNFESSEFYGNLSVTPRIAFDYNKLYLNSNNIIAKDWVIPKMYYDGVGKVNYDIFYITPAVKLEFNDIFKGSGLAYAVNFFSLDISYRRDIGSKDNFEKGEIHDLYSKKFESGFENIITFGLKTKLGLWYAVSFKGSDAAVSLDLGYKF